MKSIFLWYIPQGLIFFWGYWFASTIEPPLGGPGKFISALMLAAAYTGAVNLAINSFAWLRRRASLLRHDSQSSRDSLSLTGAGGRLPEAPHQAKRIRVSE